jgi:hypothetical protein
VDPDQTKAKKLVVFPYLIIGSSTGMPCQSNFLEQCMIGQDVPKVTPRRTMFIFPGLSQLSYFIFFLASFISNHFPPFNFFFPIFLFLLLIFIVFPHSFTSIFFPRFFSTLYLLIRPTFLLLFYSFLFIFLFLLIPSSSLPFRLFPFPLMYPSSHKRTRCGKYAYSCFY